MQIEIKSTCVGKTANDTNLTPSTSECSPGTLFACLNTKSATEFCEISSAIVNDIIYSTKGYMNSMAVWKTWYKVKHNLVVSTVPADGLAPLGAKPSAGAVMTKFR